MLKTAAAVIDLIALFATVPFCLVGRHAVAGWLLAVFSVLWLPANNDVWEGPVLFSFDRGHGMTATDLLAVGGFALAAWSLLHTPRHGPEPGPAAARRRSSRAAALVVLGAAGAAAAWHFQN